MGQIRIRKLRQDDFDTAADFAIVGMHFDEYLSSPTLLQLYARSFFQEELLRATQVIAAYDRDRLAGVLLADMHGEPKAYRSLGSRLFVGVSNAIQNLAFHQASKSYDDANAQMLASLRRRHDVDGELCFLAADPIHKRKGVGSLLLAELERRETGKRIYLYTDSNCTWQFYERRGFERVGERSIGMDLGDKGEVPLACYLYTKVCGDAPVPREG